MELWDKKGTDSSQLVESLWLDTVPESLTPRRSLGASTDVDVAIVGAGLTGLWTAYELLGRVRGAA